ncbi:MAG: hydroxyacid dehydrogenase, partial [Albidovulum sp.]
MLNPADTAFAETLAASLPAGTIGPAGPRYLEEPRRKGVTPAALLARPRSAEEVSRVVR